MPRSAIKGAALEVATLTDRWEETDFRDLRDKLVDLLVTTFPWGLAPRE